MGVFLVWFVFFPGSSLRYFLPYPHRRIEVFTELEMYLFIYLNEGAIFAYHIIFEILRAILENS